MLALALLGGCDGTTATGDLAEEVAHGAALPEDASRRLCDGSASLRLAVQGMEGFIQPEPRVRSENGVRFLFVDGACRYWVQLHHLEGVRTGTLDATQEEAVTRALLYRSWATIARTWRGAAYDGGSTLLWDAQYTVTCDAGCTLLELPPQLKELMETLEAQTLRPLWERGTAPEGGAMRLMLQESYETAYPPPFPWPLAQAPEGFVVPPSPPYEGESLLVQDAEDVWRLRDLRSAYDAHPQRNNTSGVIPVRDAADRFYGVYLRDALPFEDAKGLVRPPQR